MQTEEGFDLVQLALKRARSQGVDVFDSMESSGLLLTRARQRQIKVDAFTEMLHILDRETAEKVLQRYLGGRPATPQDMFDAVLEWLGDYKEALVAGHVG